jgi:hypothetical protein
MLNYAFDLQGSSLYRSFKHMGRNYLLRLLVTSVAFSSGNISNLCSQAPSSSATRVKTESVLLPRALNQNVTFAHSQLAFEPNLGQDNSNARFISSGQGYVLRLEPDKASIAFLNQPRGTSVSTSVSPTITLELLASNINALLVAQEKEQVTQSFFPSGSPKSWITNIPSYGRVNYKEVYPGVDLSFYGNAGRLEYDFILQPNADPGRIQLATKGAESSRVDQAGNLLLASHGAAITLLKPVAYQPSSDGLSRQTVEVRYQIRRAVTPESNGQTVSFVIGKYDRQRPLVIDPVMVYGLDIPGTPGYSSPPYYFANTSISAMTADAAGNTYVAASVGNSYASTNILKFDPTGTLLFNVSLGSTNTSIEPNAIALDATGDIYVAGNAGVGLPTTSGAFQGTGPNNGDNTGFLTVIKSDASSLIYSSYLGGNSITNIAGVAVDSSGNAYVTGSTESSNFPTIQGSYQPENPFPGSGQYAGFVTKFNPKLSGSASVVYSTYLAGNGPSKGDGIAVDASGDAYIIADGSTDFPVTQGAYNFEGEAISGAFVVKLNPQGANLVYSAFLGPGVPAGIALDTTGDVYVVGTVGSSDFPVTTGAYQTSYAGGFAAELNSAGSALVYSTFLSGPSGYQESNVLPSHVAIVPGCTSACAAYIAGSTTTTDFPLMNPIQSFPGMYGTTAAPNSSNFASGFLVELASNGTSAIYSTYLGGATSTTNNAPAVAVDSAGNAYFASNINGADAPVTLPAVQSPGEGFLAKIGPANAGATVAIPANVVFTTAQPVDSTTSAGGTVEFRNMGSVAVTLTRPFVFSAKVFSETDNCPASIPAGGICTITVSFTPASASQQSATLTIVSSAQNSPTVVTLSGTGVDGSNLGLSVTTLTFADQVILTNSTAQVVTLTNSGDEPQPITSIATGTSNYAITNGCPAQIVAGASCQVSVAFSPKQIGLLKDSLQITAPGYQGKVSLQGSGVLVSAGNGTLALSPTALNFGSVVLSQAGPTEVVSLMNTGNFPVTINSIGASANNGSGSPGDFGLLQPTTGNPLTTCGYQYNSATGGYQYYLAPFVLAPQTSCSISVQFQPSISGQEAGTLSITDSAVGSPHTIGLSGIGVNSSQSLIISPSTMTFAAQPVGDPSAAQTFMITNPGEDFVAIDRTFTTGDFAVVDGGNCAGTRLGPQASCLVSVAFEPTATGTRTGTLTLTDALSSTPSVFNLTGTGIQATGSLVLGQASLAFGSHAQGSTSVSEELVVSNPGNSPVILNSIEASGDFAVTVQTASSNSACGSVLSPGDTCGIAVAFSPTHSSGAESGSLIIHSSAGTTTVPLTGTSVASAQAVHITPTSINFGGAMVASTGQNTDAVTVYIDNTGGAAVTFPSLPAITGVSPAPGTDFQITTNNCFAYMPSNPNVTPVPMPPGASCSFTLTFTPTLVATESANLALVDSAGTQTIALSGVGTSAIPAVTFQPPVLSFDQLAVGASSSLFNSPIINLYNNSQQEIDIATVAVTAGSGDFSTSSEFSTCAGQAVLPGTYCPTTFYFHPTVAGYRTGTATFTDSLNNTYTVPLAGYGIPAVDAAILSPPAQVFPNTPLKTPYNGSQLIEVGLTNTGNVPLTIENVTGTNISATGDFPLTDSCSGQPVQPGATCFESPGFTPQALGTRTGSIVFSVAYPDQTTASFTASLSGVGVANSPSASISPQTAVFPATIAGTVQLNNQVTLIVTNTGNTPLTFGTISGADLTTTAGTGGDFVEPIDYCSGTVLPVGQTCNTTVYFAPLTTGLKSTTILVPITYTGGTTATLSASLSGQGVAAAPVLQVNPTSLAFNPEVVGTTDYSNVQTVVLSSTGNTSVKITSVTASSNFTTISNNCPASITTSCSVTVGFTPLASTPAGTVTGTLTVVDNAPGSPHVVQLSGTAVAVAQQLALSQSTVSFGNQTVSTVSAPQVVYLTDLGSGNQGSPSSPAPSRIQINSISLSGANASDFTETQTCGGNLGFTIAGRTDCIITVAFAPGATSLGARVATVTITPAQGTPLVIALNGTGVTKSAILTSPTPGSTLTGPSATFTWSPGAAGSQYDLHLSAVAVGGNELYTLGYRTITSVTVGSLPTNGATIYARLYTLNNGVTTYNDYTFTAALFATLTSPAPSSSLTSNNVTFKWSAGSAGSKYDLHLSAVAAGGYDLLTTGPITSLSVTAKGLPTNGGQIYARLYTIINGVSYYNDYTLTALSLAQLTSPAPSSTLTSNSITFAWSAGTAGSQYDLHLSAVAPGGYDLLTSGPITSLSIIANNLPANGGPIYARLYTIINGVTYYKDYTYTAMTISLARLTSPVPSSTLTSNNVTFTWSAGTAGTQNDLHLSAVSAGGYDLYTSGPVTGTSVTAKGLPTNGEMIYARLYTILNGVMFYNDYTYTAK